MICLGAAKPFIIGFSEVFSSSCSTFYANLFSLIETGYEKAIIDG